MAMSDDPEIIERLVRLETDMKWIKKEVEDLKKSINKSRWELIAGVVIMVLVTIITRLLV
ncbi:MAG: hypothetical protein QXK24_06500 [Ignisphaera sp.]